jgi:hypothetical protein
MSDGELGRLFRDWLQTGNTERYATLQLHLSDAAE